MWSGVDRGLAGIKFSGSRNRYGNHNVTAAKSIAIIENPNRSLIVWYGWNGTLDEFLLTPSGLLEPVSWRKIRWINTSRIRINGRMKWKVKNRVKVTEETAKPPQIHSTRVLPKNGIAEKKFVMTVAAQNLICPHGSTYPKKAVPMVRINIITPVYHVRL